MKTLNKRNFFNITIRTSFISAQISKLQGSTKMNQLDGFKVNDILRIKFLSKWCNLKSYTSYFNIWLLKICDFSNKSNAQEVYHSSTEILKANDSKNCCRQIQGGTNSKNLGTFYFLVKLEGLNTYEVS